MEDIQLELSQYEAQLMQIQAAITEASDGSEKENLIVLEKEINELIKLTKDCGQESLEKQDSESDPFEDEYKQFQAELTLLNSMNGNEKASDTSNLSDLTKDLKAMEGMKCQAPYKYAWTNDVTYHNALIFCIESLNSVTDFNDIKVRVMFTNPTHREMLPCPYYLDGQCKFNDEKCRFSHGETVHLNSIRDYREPVFTKLAEGKSVLAKKDDGLWYRGIIKSIDGIKCNVKFESNCKEDETFLQNIFPLDNFDEDSENQNDYVEESNSSSDDDYNCNEQVGSSQQELVRNIWNMAPPSSALGDWEKFTKGFGSRIMAKMGYIHGLGLGKEGNGRVEPVSAVVLPTGKSLDYCMNLKEFRNDEDCFKAERRMKKLQRKREKILAKSYEKEKEKEKSDIFKFLDRSLGQVNNSKNSQKVNLRKDLQNESIRNLNVTSLRLSEDVRKTEKEISALKNSLSRYSAQSKEFSILKEKLVCSQAKLSQLQASEQMIIKEQNSRRDRKKLTVF